MRSPIRLFAVATFAVGLSLLAPAVAEASPGTCKCNNGCHANPGQCVQGSGCSVGYAPSCGYRGGDSGTTATCPNVGYISCNGDCECVPIPGFCDTVGGADYCDAGVPDGGTKDTGTPTDGGVTTDSGKPDGTVTTDSGKPPTDSSTPPTDSGTTTPDSCVPLVCPPGTMTVPQPGQCDPYCAQPCGSGEFKCSANFTCDTTSGSPGFCVPDCLAKADKKCDPATCQRCDISAGTCYTEPSICGGDGGADDGSVEDDGAVTDGSLDFDSGQDDGGDQLTQAGNDTGGCNCSIPHNERDGAGLAALALAVGVVVTRRRKRSIESACTGPIEKR